MSFRLLGPFYGAIAVRALSRVVVVVVVDIDACVRQWRHLVNGRAVARSGEWDQHFEMLLVLFKSINSGP